MAIQLIAGERRLRASVIAGKHTIPAVVRTADEQSQLVPGPRREPPARRPQRARRGARVPPAHGRVRPDPGAGRATHRPLARRRRQHAAPAVRRARRSRMPSALARISEGHARALAGLDDHEQQNARAGARRAQGPVGPPDRAPGQGRSSPRRDATAADHACRADDPDLEQMTARLRDALGTRVTLAPGKTRWPDHHHLVRSR